MTEQLFVHIKAFQDLCDLLNRSRVRISLNHETWVIFDDGKWKIFQHKAYARGSIALYVGEDIDEMIRIANEVCDE